VQQGIAGAAARWWGIPGKGSRGVGAGAVGKKVGAKDTKTLLGLELEEATAVVNGSASGVEVEKGKDVAVDESPREIVRVVSGVNQGGSQSAESGGANLVLGAEGKTPVYDNSMCAR